VTAASLPGSASQILVVVTGGTIGMAPGPQGLAPEAGRVEATLKKLAHPGTTLEIERFDPLLDSAHIGHAHWNSMIDLVAAWPGSGVVITHGTDTMTYTGAALAFALAGLRCRVMLCGAMRPLGTDGAAERNLELALAAAANGPSGVWLADGGRLLAGHALVKRDSAADRAFFEIAGAEPPATRTPGPRRFARRSLAALTITPGMTAGFARAALAEVDGAIVRVYGSGTAPANPGVIDALAHVVASGRRVVAVSQCEAGGLRPGAYAAGAPLWQAGVENGGMKSLEAALASLWLDLSVSGGSASTPGI
jgi:L-asparaginase